MTLNKQGVIVKIVLKHNAYLIGVATVVVRYVEMKDRYIDALTNFMRIRFKLYNCFIILIWLYKAIR